MDACKRANKQPIGNVTDMDDVENMERSKLDNGKRPIDDNGNVEMNVRMYRQIDYTRESVEL